METPFDSAKLARPYIERLRNDPRTRAMFNGWVAQACSEAELRYQDPRDYQQRMVFAAERSTELAMSFILDNDGELTAVYRQFDELRKNSMTVAMLRPMPFMELRPEKAQKEQS